MKKFCCLFLVFALINISMSVNKYPEISDKDIQEMEIKYFDETDESQKKQIEPVIKPQKFDLNKDGKISRKEIKETLKYILYPKDPVKRISIDSKIDSHIKNNIDLYVKNIEVDFMNFKQFSYLFKTLDPYLFINENRIKGISETKTQKITESIDDL
jgi:hypothetical protein